jgi:hypothetical protein
MNPGVLLPRGPSSSIVSLTSIRFSRGNQGPFRVWGCAIASPAVNAALHESRLGQHLQERPWNDTVEAKPGTSIHMVKGMRHSIQARTPLVMLLLLLK